MPSPIIFNIFIRTSTLCCLCSSYPKVFLYFKSKPITRPMIVVGTKCLHIIMDEVKNEVVIYISNLKKCESNNTNDKHVIVNLLLKFSNLIGESCWCFVCKIYCKACRRDYVIRLIPNASC